MPKLETLSKTSIDLPDLVLIMLKVIIVIFVCVLLALVAPMAYGVPVNDTQLGILRAILDEVPGLVFADNPWTEANLVGVCHNTTLFGVLSCDDDGWVDQMMFPYGISWNNPLPRSIGQMKQLNYLYMYSTFFGGTTYPEEWGNLINLRALYLLHIYGSSNGLPESWKNMSQLNTFFLTFPFQPTSIPDWIPTYWPNLQTIDISGSQNSPSPLPTWPLSLSNLNVFIAPSNNFNGSIDAGYWTHPTLNELQIQKNQLSGSISPDLSGSSIISLNMGDNLLTGSLPNKYPPTLDNIDARNNNFSGSISPSLPNVASIRIIRLHNNGLSGIVPFPSNLSTSLLREYQISDNTRLTGSLPSGFFSMPNLLYFCAQHNSMNGNFPTQVPNTTCSIRELYATGNRFTGSLPNRLDLCPFLEVIELSGNLLTGGLPSGLQNMSALDFINLADNKMSGTLPSNWTALLDLDGIYLSNNRFYGTVPMGLLNLSLDYSLRGLLLDGNSLDLCGNPSITNETIRPLILYNCNVTAQVPRECSCPGVWTECLDVEMEAACPPPSTPTSGSTSPLTLLALQLIACVVALLFLTQ
jgi:hypothetical protein